MQKLRASWDAISTVRRIRKSWTLELLARSQRHHPRYLTTAVRFLQAFVCQFTLNRSLGLTSTQSDSGTG